MNQGGCTKKLDQVVAVVLFAIDWFAGLAQWYLKIREPLFKLCLIFGIVPSSTALWLEFSLTVLLRVLQRRDLHDFEVKRPTTAEIQSSACLLQRNRQFGPLLEGVFATMDGARMTWSSYTDPDLQNAYWECFTQAHEVTNLHVWNFFGDVVHAATTFAGSWHDSRVAAVSRLYRPRLMDDTPEGLAILGDSAFQRTVDALNAQIVRARKDNEHAGVGTFLKAHTAQLQRFY